MAEDITYPITILVDDDEGTMTLIQYFPELKQNSVIFVSERMIPLLKEALAKLGEAINPSYSQHE